MRRTAIERVGGWDESTASSEDWEMALRIAQHHGVRFVDRVVARIRVHGGNTIAAASYAARALPDRLRIVDAVLRDPATPAALAALAPRFRRDVYIGTALQFVDMGELRDALRTFASAIAVGGNPLRSAARIAWCVFAWTVIARHAWSRDLDPPTRRPPARDRRRARDRARSIAHRGGEPSSWSSRASASAIRSRRSTRSTR